MLDAARSNTRPYRRSTNWLLALIVAAMFGLVGCGDREASSAGAAVPIAFENDLGMQFVQIPAGEVQLGSEKYLYGTVQAQMSSFYMMTTEVTNAQYEAFKQIERSPLAPGDDHPVLNRPREEVLEYIAWLSERDGRRYQLPTDAQWEYAARGGLHDKDYPWGNKVDQTKANIGSESDPLTMPVGSYPPNGYGLYDMSGNAAEMVRELLFRWPEELSGYAEGKVLENPVGLVEGDDSTGYTYQYEVDEKPLLYTVRDIGMDSIFPQLWQRSISSYNYSPTVGFRLVVEEIE